MSLQTQNTADKTIRDITLMSPDSYKVFHRHGIDFCCGGNRPLAEACAEKNIDIGRVIADLDALAGHDAEETDWTKAPLQELIKNIVEKHHAYLKEELPRLRHLATTVASRHGDCKPHLFTVLEVYTALAAELDEHLEKEESILFPAIIAMEEEGTYQKNVQMPTIQILEDEHESAGQALEKLDNLTQGYKIQPAMCASSQALYIGLKQLDKDLKIHVHKENNILFPRFKKSFS